MNNIEQIKARLAKIMALSERGVAEKPPRPGDDEPTAEELENS